jgi:hypothetical protein
MVAGSEPWSSGCVNSSRAADADATLIEIDTDVAAPAENLAANYYLAHKRVRGVSVILSISDLSDHDPVGPPRWLSATFKRFLVNLSLKPAKNPITT